MISAGALFAPIRSSRAVAWTVARASLVAVALVALPACVSRSAALAPSSPTSQFTGSVGTIGGSPIAGARLTVIDGVNTGVQVNTGANGRYVFQNLMNGKFTMTISAPGFVGVSPVVDLYSDIDVDFALRAAP
jgi:hypothetical protein